MINIDCCLSHFNAVYWAHSNTSATKITPVFPNINHYQPGMLDNANQSGANNNIYLNNMYKGEAQLTKDNKAAQKSSR